MVNTHWPICLPPNTHSPIFSYQQKPPFLCRHHAHLKSSQFTFWLRWACDLIWPSETCGFQECPLKVTVCWAASSALHLSSSLLIRDHHFENKSTFACQGWWRKKLQKGPQSWTALWAGLSHKLWTPFLHTPCYMRKTNPFIAKPPSGVSDRHRNTIPN